MENVVTFSHFCATTSSCVYCLSPSMSSHLNGLVDVTINNVLKSNLTNSIYLSYIHLKYYNFFDRYSLFLINCNRHKIDNLY